MGNIFERLNDLYNLQIAARELIHGIKKGNWRPFEPSKFVYAFFAFNSFYSINWEESAKAQELIKWELHKTVDSNECEVKTESQKISEMRRFIYNTYLSNATSVKEKEDAKRDFAMKLSEKLIKYLEEDVPQTLNSLNGIVTDISINEKRKEEFIKEFGSVLKNELQGKALNDALDTTLKFVNSVRNNIFHGTKNVIHVDRSQQNRLKIYTSILLAVNELLLDAVEVRFEWSRKQVESELERQKAINSSAIERRYYNQTVASRFRIMIPDGPLFYPCVGDDTLEPIMLFLDSVSEFHFVDSRLVPKAPNLDVGITGYYETENSSRRSPREIENRTLPKELITSANAFEPYDDIIDIHEVNNLKRRGVNFAEYHEQVGKIYKQEWYLGKENKKIEIYKHKQDGLATFVSFKKIAVFFLRRDSGGEGGSGQNWFQEKLFELILDKLMDGGLIVTDGSGYDPSICDIAQWRALWANRHSRNRNGYIAVKPDDFEYYHRKIKCLGECGRGYGPIYVWQVIRM